MSKSDQNKNSENDTLFIVTFEDLDDGLCLPMSMSSDCDGALEVAASKDKFALFTSIKDARRAIRISSKFAQLCAEQGKPVNTDFTMQCLKNNIRIRECQIVKSGPDSAAR